MGALDPIAGISLERFAELCVKMKDCGGDLEVCARIAAENGVDRGVVHARIPAVHGRLPNAPINAVLGGNTGTHLQIAAAILHLHTKLCETFERDTCNRV